MTLDAIVTTVLRSRGPEAGEGGGCVAITEADAAPCHSCDDIHGQQQPDTRGPSAAAGITGGCQGLYLNKGDQRVSR